MGTASEMQYKEYKDGGKIGITDTGHHRGNNQKGGKITVT